MTHSETPTVAALLYTDALGVLPEQVAVMDAKQAEVR